MPGRSERPTADNHSFAAPEWKALLDAPVDAIIVIDHRGRIETRPDVFLVVSKLY